jgi:hypothetical protein
MLCRVDSPITVRYPAEDVRYRLTWDTKILPSCLLWPSDRSISEPPWNGRFRGLGLEPIAEMGVATCHRRDPLSNCHAAYSSVAARHREEVIGEIECLPPPRSMQPCRLSLG